MVTNEGKRFRETDNLLIESCYLKELATFSVQLWFIILQEKIKKGVLGIERLTHILTRKCIWYISIVNIFRKVII